MHRRMRPNHRYRVPVLGYALARPARRLRCFMRRMQRPFYLSAVIQSNRERRSTRGLRRRCPATEQQRRGTVTEAESTDMEGRATDMATRAMPTRPPGYGPSPAGYTGYGYRVEPGG